MHAKGSRGKGFDTDTLTKPGIDSLSNLIDIQSWTHLFKTKSLILREEQV